jgi:hypothetical protein
MVAARVPAAHRLCALPPAPLPCIKGGHHPLILPHHFPLSPCLGARYPELHRSRSPADRPLPLISSIGASTSLPRLSVSSSSLPLPFGALPVRNGGWETNFGSLSASRRSAPAVHRRWQRRRSPPAAPSHPIVDLRPRCARTLGQTFIYRSTKVAASNFSKEPLSFL